MNRRAIGMALVGAQFVLLAGIVLLPWTAPVKGLVVLGHCMSSRMIGMLL